MSIISDGVRSSRAGHERGKFLPVNLDVCENSLIKSISKSMKRKWDRRNIVPRPLLQLFYEWGYLPSEPEKGLDLWKLLDWLKVGPFETPDHANGSNILFQMIVEQELKSRSPALKKRNRCNGF